MFYNFVDCFYFVFICFCVFLGINKNETITLFVVFFCLIVSYFCFVCCCVFMCVYLFFVCIFGFFCFGGKTHKKTVFVVAVSFLCCCFNVVLFQHGCMACRQCFEKNKTYETNIEHQITKTKKTY